MKKFIRNFEPLLARVSVPVDGLTIIDGIMNGDVPFESNAFSMVGEAYSSEQYNQFRSINLGIFATLFYGYSEMFLAHFFENGIPKNIILE